VEVIGRVHVAAQHERRGVRHRWRLSWRRRGEVAIWEGMRRGGQRRWRMELGFAIESDDTAWCKERTVGDALASLDVLVRQMLTRVFFF
jgi:hypothetical protein